MDVLFRITLRRTDPSVAWGFKLRGGVDSKGTLTFQKIFPNSIADNCGLKEGDILVAVGERLTQNLNCSEVFEIIANSGNVLEIIVERPEQNNAEIHTEILPLFGASKQGDQFKSQATGVLDNENPFSDDFAKIWSTHRGKHLSSPPPFYWKSIDSQSSIFPPRHRNISDYFDKLSSSSNHGVSMPLRLHEAFDRNHGDASGEFKASSYGEPSSLSDWVQSVGDDFDDKFRKVRFAEPPESNVIDLDSTSSYAPSLDWDFREAFSARNFRNANQNIDETANNTVDSLAGEMAKIDLQKYFTDNTFGGFGLEGKSVPFPSSQWQTSYYSSSPSSYDTFPRSSKSGKKVSSRITIPIKYEPREGSKRVDILPTERSGFDSNISQFSTSNTQTDVPSASDKGNFSITSQFSHFTSDGELLSPTNKTNSRFMTSEQNPRQLPKNKNLDNLDLKKAGLFAVLDRSITDKLMNWNRPPDPEHSATYKLLKEMEKSNDDSYYG